jgi:hypothetical protein
MTSGTWTFVSGVRRIPIVLIGRLIKIIKDGQAAFPDEPYVAYCRVFMSKYSIETVAPMMRMPKPLGFVM